MKYFVGYSAPQVVSEYYKWMTADLAKKFGIINNSDRISAHLTIIYPFEVDSLEKIESIIKNFVHQKSAIPFTIKGFEQFTGNDGTVFLAVEPNLTLQSFIRDCIYSIGDPEQYYRYGSEFKLHMSIARHLTPDLGQEIMKYLKTLPIPQFELLFDNLSIFINENDKWRIIKKFELSTRNDNPVGSKTLPPDGY
jgi:2'-5' RNA ligase